VFILSGQPPSRGHRELILWIFQFLSYTVKKIYRIPVFFFYQTLQKRENPYADKGFFGALQRRNFLSFEEGKVFLSLQG
jgi:hypothetical protein